MSKLAYVNQRTLNSWKNNITSCLVEYNQVKLAIKCNQLTNKVYRLDR